MRFFRGLTSLFFLAAALCACGAPQRPAAEAPAPILPWMLCDSVTTPFILASTPPNDAGEITLSLYSKAGEDMQVAPLIIGMEEGAAGSIYLALLSGTQQIGHIKRLSSAALEETSDAFTRPVTEVALDGRVHECRWLARTRFAGFDTRRSLFITQNPDGHLTYQSFDFADADEAAQLRLNYGQRSTVPSLSIENGEEMETADGLVFRFANDGFVFETRIAREGGAQLSVSQGASGLQTTEMLAYITGPS